ncbi:MAG: thioredoxin family protein [Burkholderiales bacterium]
MKYLLLGAILMAASQAMALTLKPYNASDLAAAQAKGAPVAVHFHADWCPTCRAQTQSLDKLKAKTDLDVTVFVANYDTEKTLKAEHKVVTQSTLVVFKGKQEVSRLAGQTAPEPIEAVLRKAL